MVWHPKCLSDLNFVVGFSRRIFVRALFSFRGVMHHSSSVNQGILFIVGEENVTCSINYALEHCFY